ncbi:class I SAM-dependent methyltransferase [Salinibacter ruber]|uniref:class I SAM-dependent methyltransferase n=1 Tax=Salinibacter ruber TaxID=146919 RepID=UPI002074A2D1|nr:class I SAM-dependent methyltransferase [Salinibacter ruber]
MKLAESIYKKNIRPIISRTIHRGLRRAYYSIRPYKLPEKQKRLAREQRHSFLEGVPNSLPENHISTLEVVSDRISLLNRLPEKGRVAELGVDEGDFSEKIFTHNFPDKLYMVDVWASDRYNKSKMKKVKKRFSEEIKSGTASVIRSTSNEWLRKMDNDTLDWVYIDTSHTYEQTKIELQLSRKKVKINGLIAGHDYCSGNIPNQMNYGVIPAVHEFCVQYGWRIKYLTLETNGYRSFVLEKI